MRPSRMYYLAVALPLFAAGTAGAQSTLDAPETVSVVFAVVFAGQGPHGPAVFGDRCSTN
jgi:hypothetical protein